MTDSSLFAGNEPMPITLEAQIACAENEIRMRLRVYPRLVGNNKLTQKKADDEVAAMRAILRTLTGLQQAAPIAVQRIRDLEAVLKKVRHEISERSDVKDGPEGRQLPNQAMELETLLTPMIDTALARGA